MFPCLGCWMILVYPSGSTLCLTLPWQADFCELYQQTPWLSEFQLDLANGSIYRRFEGERKEGPGHLFTIFIMQTSKLLSVDSLCSSFIWGPVTALLLFIPMSLGAITAFLYYHFWWFIYTLPSFLYITLMKLS